MADEQKSQTMFDPKAASKAAHQRLLEDCKEFLEKDKIVRLSISEREFVDKYLPLFFAGGEYIDPDTKEKFELPVAGWIQYVAQTPYNEVNVIGPDGTVLFAVPPLLASAGTYQSTPMHSGKPDINNAFTGAMVSMDRGSDTHGRELTELGGKFLSDLESSTQDIRETHRQRWLAIYQRYGLIPTTNETQVADNDSVEQFSGEVDSF